MKQHVDLTLKLSLWIDASLSRDAVAETVTERLIADLGPEISPMLHAVEILSIREEADIYGTELPTLLARFDDYEIHGMKRLPRGVGQEEEPRGFVTGNCEQVPDAEAEFWSLFGHIPGQGLDCIGDFATRDHAEQVYARITGQRYA
jgi:hypothetical protein